VCLLLHHVVTRTQSQQLLRGQGAGGVGRGDSRQQLQCPSSAAPHLVQLSQGRVYLHCPRWGWPAVASAAGTDGCKQASGLVVVYVYT
jgi:hypothetical protein